LGEMAQIYGKAGCPYTDAARRDLEGRSVPFEYFDVKKDPAAMERFLELSGGERRVPLIVERGRVGIGFGGT
jgi:glutaredoxin 3